MKLLIADDEDYTREGIIEAIEWERYGIDEIMQAVNGAEAARIAQYFMPDIILTDVRMPKMDGIEFAEKLLQWNPDCRIIFMSGYMEIEYLKSAIRLSAIDYIEKPIDLEIMEKALAKAVDELGRLHKNKEATQMNLAFLQQKLFGFLTSKEAEEKTLEKLAKEAEFSLAQNYVCVIVQFSDDAETVRERQRALDEFLLASFCQIIGVYQAAKKQFEYVLAFDEKEQYRVEPLYWKLLEAFPGAKLGAGIEVKTYKNIYNSYKTAGAAMNCAFYQQEQRLFQIDEQIMHKSSIEPGIYGEFLQMLSERPEDMEAWFAQLFGQLYRSKYYQKEQVYTLMISLLTAIYAKYPELYGRVRGIEKEEQLVGYIRSLMTLKEIQRFVDELLYNKKERCKEQNAYSRVIRGVMDYVAAHYQEEELSVTDIAGHLHLSSAYLNVLFKQEMKMTLKQYLSNYRLECAKRMLEQGYEKVTEIARLCGYANSNYFAKVFREATGMSPAEYRGKRE